MHDDTCDCDRCWQAEHDNQDAGHFDEADLDCPHCRPGVSFDSADYQ